jgi:uncharacterized protein
MTVACKFFSDDLELAGLLDIQSLEQGVVVTHPHPLYGGDMENNVVKAITDTYQGVGYSTLRFNFRGVAPSQGRYDEGRGEQQDVVAAVAYIKAQGVANVELVGYSFGAWVGAQAVSAGLNVPRMVMVSPPVAFIDFSAVNELASLDLVVTGSLDEFAPVGPVNSLLAHWNPEAYLEVIQGGDHFYGGYIDELKAILQAHLASRP